MPLRCAAATFPVQAVSAAGRPQNLRHNEPIPWVTEGRAGERRDPKHGRSAHAAPRATAAPRPGPLALGPQEPIHTERGRRGWPLADPSSALPRSTPGRRLKPKFRRPPRPTNSAHNAPRRPIPPSRAARCRPLHRAGYRRPSTAFGAAATAPSDPPARLPPTAPPVLPAVAAHPNRTAARALPSPSPHPTTSPAQRPTHADRDCKPLPTPTQPTGWLASGLP